MPIYEYKGYDSSGKSVKGTQEADSDKSLRVFLRKGGVFATEVRESGVTDVDAQGKKISFFKREVNFNIFRRVNTETLSLMTRQLGTLLQAGVPMVDALNALIEQVDNPVLKRVLSQVKAEVNEGSSLADAMQKHTIFSNIYINMVRAGETSGALEIVLERLADFTESQAQLRSKVMGAMMYPAIMAFVAAAVMVGMLTVVVPRLARIFEHAKTQLPIMTRILISMSGIARSYWWLIFIVVGSLVFLVRRYIKTPKGRLRWDGFLLKMPVFGPIVRMVAVARFSRTLSTLMASGVPLLTALQIVRNVVSNAVLEVSIDQVRDAVREGEDIATPLKRTGQFPPMVTHMIAIGEKSGELETMLVRIASSYEQRVQGQVAALTGLLEPVMILLMAGIVAFIVFAMLTPILQMSQLVQ